MFNWLQTIPGSIWGISSGETAKRAGMALRHSTSPLFNTNKKPAPLRTNLVGLSSSCTILKSPYVINLRSFDLTPDSKLSLSFYRISSSCTSKSIVLTKALQVFFFVSEVTVVTRGFFSIVSCISRASRRPSKKTTGLLKLL